jgi:hypothetical protein
VGPRTGLEDVEKRNFLPLPRLNCDHSIVQHVASRYTICAVPAPALDLENTKLKDWVKIECLFLF